MKYMHMRVCMSICNQAANYGQRAYLHPFPLPPTL